MPDIREISLPPENFIFTIKAFIYRVSYRNVGKQRFSAEPVAMAMQDQKTNERKFLMLDGSKQTKTAEEMDLHLRSIMLEGMEDIQEPPPKPQNNNVTLNVQSGKISPQSMVKPKAPPPNDPSDGQEKG